MAQDLSADSYPNVSRFTMGATDVLTELQMPAIRKSGGWVVTVRFITNDGKLTHTGTDGGAIGSDYMTITADSPAELLVSKSRLYVASATGSTVCEVMIEEVRP